jgi:hypothetical protein
MPIGTDQVKTDSITKIVEERIYKEIGDSNKIVESVISNVAIGAGDPTQFEAGAQSHLGKVTVAFVEFGKRNGEGTTQYLDKIRKVVSDIPGVQITVEQESNGPPTGKPVNIEIIGDDFEELTATSKDIKRYLDSLQIPGIEELKSDLITNKPEILIEVDKERANREGITSAQIGQALRGAIFGIEVSKFKDMSIYLLSLFFAMASLGIVISFAFIYGAQEIKIEEIHRVVMFVLLQITAALGAFIFGFIQDRLGALKTFNFTLVLWIFSILAIFGVNEITIALNSITGLELNVKWVFVFITCFAGLGLGATQSSSRAIIGMFSPESKIGEFYGLWGLSGKIAAAIGLFAVSILQGFFGFKNSFLIIAIFFIFSLVANLFVDEARGKEVGRTYKE